MFLRISLSDLSGLRDAFDENCFEDFAQARDELDGAKVLGVAVVRSS